MNTQHVHTDELNIALADGECGVRGPCEADYEGCLIDGQCQVDPYDIDVNDTVNYRILCTFCASEIADDI